MSDHYDVIIVGSGAGGGTLAHRLAPSGKRILILERGDWLPREIENWDAEAVFVDNRYISPDTWYDANGKAFQPQVHYFVGGATKFYGAALYRLRERDFGELKHHGGISPAWPIGYDVWSPTTRRPSSCIRSTAPAARTRPTRRPRRRTPFRRSPTSPGSSGFRRPDAVGLHPFHSPSGVMLDEGHPANSRVHPVRHLRRLSVPGARQGRRRRRRRTPALEHATSPCSSTPVYAGWRPTRPAGR